MQCYYYLPWRVTSRVIGWLSSIEIPQKFRPFVYNKYAEFFGVNLDEIDCDIHLFPSLSDFFVRPLKPNTRPIAMNANIVSNFLSFKTKKYHAISINLSFIYH